MACAPQCCATRRRWLFVIPAVSLLVCICAGLGNAQGLPGLPVPSATSLALPPGVRQEGPYLTAPVWLDGMALFRIATPATVSGDQMSVEARAQFVEAALAQLVALRGSAQNSGTLYDPKTLRVKIQPDGSQAILEAVDARHATPLPILTVTSADAKYQSEPTSKVAQQWRTTLQSALVQALDKRQPAVLARNLADLWRFAVVFVLVSLVIVATWSALRRRETALAGEVEADQRAIDEAQSQGVEQEEAAGARRRSSFMGLAMRAADPAMSLAILRATGGLLLWALVLLWFGGLVWALSLFPQTTPLGEIIFHRTSRVAFTWIGAALLVRIAAIIVGQLARSYRTHARGVRSEESARRLLRVPTVANTVVAITSFVVYFVAILTTLSLLGISAGSVLTIGGLVALALSLAAQNLVRDFLNGFLVLVEDQYVVGDYVIIGDRSGLVEHMSLRVVQLRDGAGNLVTIPHSAVTQVVNCSRNWSRVDYKIAIDPGADSARAIEILRHTIDGLAADQRWRGAIADPVEWIGIDSLSTAGIVLRASVRTAPLRQFEVRREINARMVEALRVAQIALGTKDAYAV
jgi:moderate conductance mechanosensitive channel